MNRDHNLCISPTGIFVGGAACGRKADRGDAGACAPRPAAVVRPAPVSLTLVNRICALSSNVLMKWLWTALLIICLAPLQAVAVSNGDSIINIAELHTQELLPFASSVTVIVVTGSAAPTIEFLKYAPTSPTAVSENVGVTLYRTGSDPAAPFAALPAPVPVGNTSPIDLTRPVPLVPTDILHQCEPIFVRVTDQSQNLNHTLAETVLATISTQSTGNMEVLRLTETGPNTGVYVGYIQTAGKACLENPRPAPYSGAFPVTEATKVTATYTVTVNGGASVSCMAMVDPFGILFDSITGKPVNGVTITLLDVSSGKPATVYGDDGVSTFPATVSTGSTPVDSSGRSYTYPPGEFRFPFVKPGNYQFQIKTPPGYSLPSVKSDESLQALPGGPFAISAGSRLSPFVINPGPTLHIDIPMDPLPATLWLQKTAGKGAVAIGDFLPYQLDLQNTHAAAAATGVTITDTLPLGFRYRKGSAIVSGKPAADPAISADGRILTFPLGDLAAKAAVSIRFVVEVAAGAKVGIATNVATAHSSASASNTAQAAVQVQSDFIDSHSILMGRVGRGPCNLDWEDGVEGVRIYLEDGTYVATDKRGMYHFEGVKPGTHVVQLDLDSLPEGFEVYSCEENSRFAGRSFSQFVDLQGGAMWRADFRAGKADDAAVYRKRAEERLAAERLAAEKIQKAADAVRQAGELARKLAAAAKAEEEEAESPKDDWAPSPTTAAAEKNDEDEPVVDDWATPAPSVPAAEKKAEQLKRAEQDQALKPSSAEEKEVTANEAAAPAMQGAASLELQSTLEQGRVILTPTVEISSVPLATQRLEVELPQGLVYAAGSATRDGSPLDDPEIQGKTLTFSLGSITHNSTSKLRFAADFSSDAPSGEYITRAVLIHTTDHGIAGRTPYADNVLVRIKEEERSDLPSIVVYPKFNIFDDQLSAEDRKMLDETTLMIRKLKERRILTVRQLLLVGHTDDTRIAKRSRHIHRDNMALSKARARNVAIYLKEQLGLTPAQISASGKGESSPVASNRTADGRDQNRRVEVIILTEQVAERVNTRLKKGTSGVQRGGSAAVPSDKGEGAPSAASGHLTDYDPANIVPVSSAIAPQFTSRTADGPAAARSDVNYLRTSAPNSQPAPSGIATGLLPLFTPPSLFAPAAGGSSPTVDAAGANADSAVKEPAEEELRLTTVGILSPADGGSLPDPISAIRVVLDAKLTPQLFVDGVEIPADRIGFTLKDNKSEKTLYSYIGVNFGDPGLHTITLVGKDPFGIVRFEKKAKITRVGAIATIRFVGAEGNVADGKTPVRLKLELFDSAGAAIHAATELQILEGTLRPVKKENLFPDSAQLKGEKGEKVQVDADGFALFQPVNDSGIYRTVLGAGKTTVEAETYVKPKMRKWILVGLGEGTVGYNTVSGHMGNLQESGTDENLYENGRLAFYGKGTIKGEWLLTMAYDSAKARGDGANSLFQTINPNAYYTLYGDASQQQYDAASARKLFLKIEHDQFYALFGDYDTGLTVTELSRYSRRMNGVKAEYQGKNLEANVFGAETGQAYARDEIQGDGTSGLYHLSRKNIVLNSDKITIETRDRFRSEIIVNSQTMNRFSDYSIDYVSGTIFFKAPVFSKDENFNPVYIVVEYETLAGGTESLTYGGRVGTKMFDQKLKAGVTYIHEGQVSGGGNLYGLDATWKIGTGTTLKAEAARTDTDFGGATLEGNAYLAELGHNSANLSGKLYFREQDNDFGLGQQNGSETGTRKFGIDAAYKLTEKLSLSGLGYRQYNLATSAVEDVTEVKATYSSGPYSSHLGLRYASDRLGDGSVHTSEQLTMGGSWLTLNKRLTLRADHDQSIGGNSNADFPTRTTIGADFKLTDKVFLFAQQEITSGSTAKTNTTRVGVKSTPWGGGAINTSMERSSNENGDRLFALFGLKQTWKVTDKWSVDGGLDRNQTIMNAQNYSFNVNVPPASGATESFSAVSLGSTYTEKKWNWTNRLEYRTSSSEDKWGMVSAYVGEPKEGWGWSGRFELFDTKSTANGSTVNGDLRFGLVYRPLDTRWIILDRLDLLYNMQDGGSSCNLDSRRIVNNLIANFKPDKKTQISLLYGAKYALETIDGSNYSGFTDLIGIEGRYDLTKKWDVGLRGSILHSWSVAQFNYSAGPSLGYNVMENAWVSVGYNLCGFDDKDFSSAAYTAQGPYVRFRMKFDQQTVKDAAAWLNRQ